MLAQTFADIEVIVVDNASSDDSLAQILEAVEHTSNVRVVSNPTNLGFAKGMNRGIAEASGEFVVPLNCDAELQPDYVATLVDVLEGAPRAAVAGGLVRSAAAGDSGPLAITATMRTESLLAYADRVGTPHKRHDGQAPAPMTCDKVNGACPLMRRSALQQVIDRFGGPYESTYDTYGEDVDLALTLGRLGWQYLFVPTAEAHHVRSYSSAPKLADRSGRLRVTTLANRHRNIVRHAPKWIAVNALAVGQDIGFAVLRLAHGDLRVVGDVGAAWRVHGQTLASDLERRRALALGLPAEVTSWPRD